MQVKHYNISSGSPSVDPGCPLGFLAGLRLNHAFSFVSVRLECASVRLLLLVCITFVCIVYVSSLLLYFGYFVSHW